MQWASAVSSEPALGDAVRDAGAAIRGALGGGAPDLVVAFVSEQYQREYDRVAELVRRECPSGVLIGCSAGGVIGGGHEVEHRPGVSLTAAVMPGVTVTPFAVSQDLPSRAAPGGWERLVPSIDVPDPQFVLLSDPFSVDAEAFLRALDAAAPASRIIGGLASGGRTPGSNVLLHGESVMRAGLVGVALSGDVCLDTVVAQGCRPIGLPMFATACQGNVLWELDGRSAVRVLQDLYEQLDAEDQRLARHSLFLGIVMNEDRQEYRQGDYLIRNIVGMDAERGALAVGALLRENAVVQFHLRDATTSAQDLERLLGRQQAQGTPYAGALLFSCLGRGVHLYGRADHDTDVFRQHMGEVPLGGFFCNGEIGPVNGTTYLHGYTSAFGLFRPR